MNMKLPLLVVAATLVCASPAPAQVKGFGPGFDNWNFTATKEGKGVTNCRATRRVGGRDDIIALKTDRKDYVSVRAEDRKGRWAESFIVPFREPSNGQQYPGTVEADGKRMWMLVDRNFIETIMQRGGYDLYLGGSEDTDKAPLGSQAAKAFIRLKECIVANGG
ncbi:MULTISPECIES: hypothetical protein [unclassified Methylosinus]|jgi:hypothetical protein|uniref:hypothetical protein n=1 Tax=unclassified Methylosinus TaxID=2624500 RepID=UPI001064A6DB|nr:MULTISPECIES: hypothetical protein [unclassified Methylosinus]